MVKNDDKMSSLNNHQKNITNWRAEGLALRASRTHTNISYMINLHCTSAFGLPAQRSRTALCMSSAPGSELDFSLITARSSVSSTQSAIAGVFLQAGYSLSLPSPIRA